MHSSCKLKRNIRASALHKCFLCFCRYVGTQAIQFIRAKGQSPTISTIAHSSYMDIFQNLAVDMDTEGR